LKHVCNDSKNGKPRIRFLVKFFGGDKNWFCMNDLRLHDPFKVYQYGKKEIYLDMRHLNGQSLSNPMKNLSYIC
jgi:hypothetical protein